MTHEKVSSVTPDTIVAFQNSLSAQGCAEATVKGYASDLRMFLQEMSRPSMPLSELPAAASLWLNLSRTKLAARTVERRLSSLRAFYSWAGKKKQLLQGYRLPTAAQPVPHPLPGGMNDVHELLLQARYGAHGPVNSCLIALCGLAGLRVSEARAVKPSDFKFDPKFPTLEVRGKGDKRRHVPVSYELLAQIMPRLAACSGDDSVLVPLQDRSARLMITRMGRKAGITRSVSSHDLRMTFATHTYNKTLDIRVVQQMLGHASVEVTQRYIAVSVETMHKAVA